MGKVYVLRGENEYLKEQELRRLERGDVFKVPGDEVDENFISSLFAPGMFEERTFVVMDAGNMKKDAEEKLLSALKSRISSTLVLYYREKEERSRKFEKLPGVEVRECKKIGRKKLPGWIKEYVRKNGKSIDDDAVYFLMDAIGDNIKEIADVLDRVMISVKERITLEDVKSFTSFMRENVIWEIAKVFVERHPAYFVEKAEFISSFPKPEWIIGKLTNVIYFLLRMKAYQILGKDVLELDKRKFREYVRYVDALSFEDIKRLLSLLIEMDYRIKRGMERKYAFTEFFVKAGKRR